jgi:hypothetical protein
MEDLFAPTNRYRDLYRARERDDDDDSDDEEYVYNDRRINDLVELELITGSSAEDTFLHSGFALSDFYSWARGKIVWISTHVFFDLSRIATCFQTEYRSILTVNILPNEEDTSRPGSKKLYVRAR